MVLVLHYGAGRLPVRDGGSLARDVHQPTAHRTYQSCPGLAQLGCLAGLGGGLVFWAPRCPPRYPPRYPPRETGLLVFPTLVLQIAGPSNRNIPGKILLSQYT